MEPREDTGSEVVTVDRGAHRAPLTWSPPTAVLSIALGGVVFRHVSQDPARGLTLSNRFELFRVPESLDADCTVSWSTGIVSAGDGKVLQGTDIWEARQTPGGGEQTVFFAGNAKRPYLSLTFDPRFEMARVVRASSADNAAFSPEVHPVSEYLTSRVLARAGRVEVHCSAAVASGRALLFVGHSGAGKTTISRIAEKAGASVLTDDRAIVGMSDGQPTVWGTPWHGSGWYTSAESSAIAGVFLLRQGVETRVTPIAYADAIKELFVRSIQVRVRPDEVAQSHAVLENVLAVAPTFELTFSPTVSAFGAALQAVRRQASQ